MDRITKSLLDEFVSENSLGALPEQDAFEHFVAFLTTSTHFSGSFASGDVVVGAGGDGGMDAISIIVNGSLISDPEEIDDLVSANGYLDAVFVFLQAERSESFSTAKIGQFGFGVADFLAEEPTLTHNDDVQHKRRIVDKILSLSAKFSRGNPRCFLYYATTGTWTGDRDLEARRQAVVSDLRDLQLFRDTKFECVGATKLQGLYRAAQNAVSIEIAFSNRTPFPEIGGISDAYIGLLPATEYLKLIGNANDEIMSSLFFDNVRDWQQWNPVNTEMRETLSDANAARRFPLQNNGVTIVAKSLNATANKMLLEDYQIVNGCQTSYVLFEMREKLSDSVMVPVRLIATQDEEIKNAIIKATNRQTQVTDDQLFALAEFPKKLEAYFPTFEGSKKLYYERRSRQYAGVPGVEKVRVINMTNLVRAVAAIYLERPHRTTRNYKALLAEIGETIFKSTDRMEMYYVAAYAHYKLEYLFRNQTIAKELKAARYHMLLGFRLLAAARELPPFNSVEMRKYCEALLGVLWNDENSVSLFQQSAATVREVADGNLHRDNIRTEPFTNRFIAQCEATGGS